MITMNRTVSFSEVDPGDTTTLVKVELELEFVGELTDIQQLALNILDALESQTEAEGGLAPNTDDCFTHNISVRVGEVNVQ